jgi:hypothetical protein
MVSRSKVRAQGLSEHRHTYRVARDGHQKAGGATTPLDRAIGTMANDNSPPVTKEPADTTTDEPLTNDTQSTLERTTIGAVNASGWINPDTFAGDCSVTVDATHDERGRSEIELRTAVGGGEVSVALNPEAAAQLAAKLRSAAAYADGGER